MNSEPHNLFLIKEEQIQNSQIILTGSEYHHIKNVLRKKPGDIIYLTDGSGIQFQVVIENIIQNAMVCKILEKRKIPRTNIINLDLGIAPLKGGRTDFIIEKGTELGVRKFILFNSKFSVIKNFSQARIEHFKRIGISAMLQSQQYYIPEVKFSNDITEEFSNYDLVIVGDKNGNDRIVPGIKNILLLIGPEGGFAPEEIDAFSKKGAKFTPFSKNRLRSETAAIAGIVKIISYYEQ
jgi:16S rRNA (uracil1498-N3)-methyltransferase|uniref:Ribosomal RNA small subunit methyltransferase E n=1 Tax=candidate division WOR-3 bacterium TaxID=2052148 RepID=A0A7C4THN0_UNCW3